MSSLGGSFQAYIRRSRCSKPRVFCHEAIATAVPDHIEPFIRIMAGLVPAIHVFLPRRLARKGVDARDKRGHDAGEVIQSHRNPL
jgi:hypothetical protein